MATKVCKQCGEKVAISGDHPDGIYYYECPKCGPTAVDEVYTGPEEVWQDYPCRLRVEFFCVFKGRTSADAERKSGAAVEEMLNVLKGYTVESRVVRLSNDHEPGALDALPNEA